MNKIFEKIYEYGIIPVVTVNRAADAIPLAKALSDGGIPVAEITFRTQCAAAAIAEITKALPDMLVGAGTVLMPAQADEAVNAGAAFIVSPGFNPKVGERCASLGIPYLPGCATPTELEAALSRGFDTVKFFPAEANGGVPMLKALSAPYKDVRFVPTGGIDLSNLAGYIALPNVLAAGGSFMVDKALIAAGDFAGITRLTREAVFAMYGFSLAHIGINCDNESDAQNGAVPLCDIFGLTPKDGAASVFAGSLFELMKTRYYGENGHIAIATNTIERAVKYMERLGYTFEPDGMKYNDRGQLNAAYIKGDFSGFAIHLYRK